MAETFRDHFSGAAPSYAAFRPKYPPELADALTALAPAHALAWDVGAGSGQFSLLLAERFERVIATDASSAQLASAAPHPRVEYRVEPSTRSSLLSASVDLVTVAQAVHWFDIAPFCREARRVAKPGGVVAWIAYGNALLDPDLEPMFVRFYEHTIGSYWPPERRHIEAGYRDLEFPFDEIPFADSEIRVELDVHELLGYVSTWSAILALVRAGKGEEFERFRRDFLDAWGPPSRKRLVRWPLTSRVGRV